ncbi:IS1380-like element ISMsm12 family transposase [Mycolicibacterium goodii]|uniref:IS1380-like element ISMsm12 family transposase n=1 Tax=Mycolicibacterium goodii TaxID=134601 RepID=A0ABS6HQF2_MYCGD|nr:IS1380-like element ISMsm12 family transposase [Mycolicibacterium goodii]MBU8824924.1 IS1380-like element ISMsm12 family transposase [Mycolicibacterium goodii]MBU8839923.1 IS1380-like element ISMsm12 family transposase [Mycolicibacterium goodii]
MELSHRFAASSAVFDDDHLVSIAGLVPVMTLATQTGLSALLADKVRISEPRIKSGSANPSPKLTTLIAGMCAGADSIDDLDIVRSGGMKTLFDDVYAPSTIGTLLREFTFGHARQLEAVLRAHLAELCQRADLLPGIDGRTFVDIDSLLRPVYGHAKQGASYGHTKIAGKQILRKGLSPLITTISSSTSAPVIAGARLRAGKTNSGKGAARMIAQAVATARAAGVTGPIFVRGDSAYGNSTVAAACRRAGAQFSLVLTKTPAVTAAIDAISDGAWIPVNYPGAVRDPDTGAWISDAEVAETTYTAFSSTKTPITARLIVRRVKDARFLDALFPVWRYHPFFTDSDEPVDAADITHRRHAIIETVFADLIDGPLAHMPSGRFGANSAWILCAAIAHNLLRAAGVLAGTANAVARGSTLRRRIVTVPARLARPQRRPVLHLPTHWPWTDQWLMLWRNTIGYSPPATPCH